MTEPSRRAQRQYLHSFCSSKASQVSSKVSTGARVLPVVRGEVRTVPVIDRSKLALVAGTELRSRQYLYFCTRKACELSTTGTPRRSRRPSCRGCGSAPALRRPVRPNL
jgi:hypothetical protein